MWGKGKGIDLLSFITCAFQAFCGLSIYLGFCETNTNKQIDFMTEKLQIFKI